MNSSENSVADGAGGRWLWEGKGEEAPSDPVEYIRVNHEYLYSFCLNMFEREDLTDLLKGRYILKCAHEWVTRDFFDSRGSSTTADSSGSSDQTSSPPPSFNPSLSSESPSNYSSYRGTTFDPTPMVNSSIQEFSFHDEGAGSLDGYGGVIGLCVGAAAIVLLLAGVGFWRFKCRKGNRIYIPELLKFSHF